MTRDGSGKLKGRRNRRRTISGSWRWRLNYDQDRSLFDIISDGCMGRGAEIRLRVGLPYARIFPDIMAHNTFVSSTNRNRRRWLQLVRRNGPFRRIEPMTAAEALAYERELGIE